MAETLENLAELYYARLKTSTNPGVVLAQFYSAIFGKETGRAEIIAFNRLLKIFGKFTVYFAVIEISRMETITDFPFGLLFKICRDRLESSVHTEVTSASSDNLDRKITDLIKDIEKVKKIDPEKVSKYFEDGGKKDVG